MTKTPQAVDDFLAPTTLTEDSVRCSRPVYLDVMANDKGGNGKKLYSVDDDDVKDLLEKDSAGTPGCRADRSVNGATIWITKDGKIGYDASTLSSEFRARLQTLSEGEYLADTFIYAIQLGNGTLSWATVTVQIAGANDAPVITSASQTGSVQEDVTLVASGKVTAKDVDRADTLTFSVLGGGNGDYGKLTVNALTGAWTYTLDNGSSAVQSLAGGETEYETFTIRVRDNHGGYDDTKVTIKVRGTNDAPVIISGEQTGAVKEDVTLSASGRVRATDDGSGGCGDDLRFSGDANGVYGSFRVDGNDGDWRYTLNNSAAAVQALAQGETRVEVFKVRVTDGAGAYAEQEVRITVTGTNDGPVIQQPAQAVTVIEDTVLQATGQFTARDADNGATQAWSVVGGGAGAYGVLSVDAAGVWRYTLDNAAAQSLAGDKAVTETFTVKVSDQFGATDTEVVKVTIKGTNDGPTLRADAYATSEDDVLDVAANGVLANDSDIDLGDTLQVVAGGPILSTRGATVTLNADGSFSYDARNSAELQALGEGEVRADTFSYTVTDGHGGTATATVTVQVSGRADGAVPVISGDLTGAVDADAQPILTFGAPTLHGAGADVGPFGIAAADLDGDGRADVVTANYFGSGVSVLLGDGAGGLSGPGLLGTLETGLLPQRVDLADLNADGRLDVVTADYSSNTLSVFLGGGDGLFGPRVEIATGGFGPFDIAVGDVNGDGEADLVASDLDSATVSVLLGDGNGAFVLADVLAVGASPFSVQLADVDGDGRTDILTADFSAGTISVLLATSSGFEPRAAVDAGSGDPFDLAVADLNGDGALDLVTANLLTDSVSVLLGDGAGGFGPASVFGTGATPYAVAVADINLDGRADIVTADNGGTASVLLGDGSGGFAAPASFALGASPNDLALADMNGDGWLDILAPSLEADAVAVILNESSNGLTAEGQLSASDPDGGILTWSLTGGATGQMGEFSIDNAGAWTYTLFADSPALLALAEGEQHVETFMVRVANAGGGFDEQPIAITITGRNDDPSAADDALSVDENSTLVFTAADLLANDTDVDGDALTLVDVGTVENGTLSYDGATFSFVPDEFFTGDISFSYTVQDAHGALSSATATISVLPVQNPPEISGPLTGVVMEDGVAQLLFASPNLFATGGTGLPFGIAAGDLNGDGLADMVTANYQGNSVSVLLGDGAGGLGLAGTYAAGSGPQRVALGDFNGDGRLDIATADFLGNGASVLLGNGDGSFGARAAIGVGASGPFDIAVGDVNGDGRADLATSDLLSGRISVLLGDGTGGFAAPALLSTGPNPYGVQLADLNGDGRDDVITSGLGSGAVSVFLAAAGGGFGPRTDYAGGRALDIAVADLDGNGTLDLVAANTTDNTVTLLLGDGAGGFTTGAVLGSGVQPYAVSVADITGDGYVDIITADNAGTSASVLVGNGSGFFGSAVSFDVGSFPSDLALADLDGDGRMDIAVPAYGSHAVAVVLNASAGGLVATGQLTATDPDDGTVFTWSVPGGGSGVYGEFSVDATGKWTYVLSNDLAIVQALADGEEQSETFTVRVADEHGNFDEQSVEIVIKGNNDDPRPVDDTASVDQNGELVIAASGLIANDLDDNGDTMQLFAVEDAVNGTVAIDGTDVVFTPTAGFTGAASFNYLVEDAGGLIAAATVHVTVGNFGQTLNGTGANNTLNGGAGADVISGLGGADTLNGNAGNDTLNGGSGNDILAGGTGRDTLTGGTGADTFRFSPHGSRDVVTDFTAGAGGDRLDIRDLLVGYDPAESQLSEFLQLSEEDDGTVVAVDRDGAGAAHEFVDIALLQSVTGLLVDDLAANGNLILS